MRKSTVIAAALLAIAVSPSKAHHSANAQYDVAREVELTGELVRLRAVAPHTLWELGIKNAQGQVENWTFESASPAVLRRNGVQVREDVKVGDTFTVYFNPPRSPAQKMGFMRAVLIEGKKVSITQLEPVRGE